jgi:prepilin-type N-terminal cleavage/methylation domain-containing protein
MRAARSTRGFTFLEAMAAIAIVGLAILASTGFMMRRAQISRQIDEHVRVDQALASEMDVVLASMPASLTPGDHPWRSQADKGLRLAKARGVVHVLADSPGLRLVRVELTWGRDHVMARERLVEAP